MENTSAFWASSSCTASLSDGDKAALDKSNSGISDAVFTVWSALITSPWQDGALLTVCTHDKVATLIFLRMVTTWLDVLRSLTGALPPVTSTSSRPTTNDPFSPSTKAVNFLPLVACGARAMKETSIPG